MPVFDTPEPISVTIDISVGDVRITAEDRSDTVVEVRPTDETDGSDVKAAGQTSVEYADGVLVIKGPKPRVMDFSRKTRSVDVSVVLPAGSHVRGEAAVGDLSCSGRLGECRYKTSTGHARLDQAGPLNLSTVGHVTVGRVDGDAEVRTTVGRISIGEIDGAAVVKGSNGTVDIGKVTGDIDVHCANGDISVDHAWGLRTDIETANGSIRVGEVTGGAVVLRTASGDLEIGIGAGRPAKLDLTTGFGRVHNMLESTDESSEESVEVLARTSYGDISVHRA
ncbi:DUF4097 family beta strand repeat-containing protein [Streptomyces sp. Tue 6430]|nr:DUF4097 family beta strand repeat-containing protein [Streptomyces sp. Tue 6430]